MTLLKIAEAKLAIEQAEEAYSEVVFQYVRLELRKIQKLAPSKRLVFRAQPDRMHRSKVLYYQPDFPHPMNEIMPPAVRAVGHALCDWFDDLDDVWFDDIDLEATE